MLNAIKVVKLPPFGVVSLLENMLSFYLILPKVSTSIPLWENLWSWGPKPQIWYYKPLINPKLGGSFFYTPPQIHYLASHNHFDVVETQISESDTNELTQFDDGASIVTLHFRRVQSWVIFTWHYLATIEVSSIFQTTKNNSWKIDRRNVWTSKVNGK